MYKTDHAIFFTLLISSLVLFVVIGTMAAFMFRFYFKKVAIQKELQRRNLSKVEMERQRIAESIESSLEPTLAQVLSHLDTLSKAATAPSGSLDRAIARTKRAVRLARDLRAVLQPPRLASDGLAVALKDICNVLEEQSSLSIVFRSAATMRYPFEKELHIFRIAEEILDNIIAHANASQVTVDLAADNAYLDLVIVDDGIGINLSNIQKDTNALGFRAIVAHADQINGEIHFQEEPEQGTHFHLRVPM